MIVAPRDSGWACLSGPTPPVLGNDATVASDTGLGRDQVLRTGVRQSRSSETKTGFTAQKVVIDHPQAAAVAIADRSHNGLVMRCL